MTAYNSVRFKVKAGKDQQFIDLQKEMNEPMRGFRKGALIKTGDGAYAFIGEWDSMKDLAAARPTMIRQLDKMRPLLEDLGGGLGVTDPISGDAVVEL